MIMHGCTLDKKNNEVGKNFDFEIVCYGFNPPFLNITALVTVLKRPQHYYLLMFTTVNGTPHNYLILTPKVAFFCNTFVYCVAKNIANGQQK